MGDKHTSSNPSHPSNISRVHILTCLLLPGLWWWWESYPLPNIIHRQGQPQGHGPLWVWTEALWVSLHCGEIWTLYLSLQNKVRVNFNTKSHSLNFVRGGILFKLRKKSFGLHDIMRWSKEMEGDLVGLCGGVSWKVVVSLLAVCICCSFRLVSLRRF